MGWDGKELIPLTHEQAQEAIAQAPEMVFSEGEEVTVKGVVFTVSLIEPPRIVLKAKSTADRAIIGAAKIRELTTKIKQERERV